MLKRCECCGMTGSTSTSRPRSLRWLTAGGYTVSVQDVTVSAKGKGKDDPTTAVMNQARLCATAGRARHDRTDLPYILRIEGREKQAGQVCKSNMQRLPDPKKSPIDEGLCERDGRSKPRLGPVNEFRRPSQGLDSPRMVPSSIEGHSFAMEVRGECGSG